MEPQTNIISAEELFGVTSRVVAHDARAELSGIASLGAAYQAVVAIVALLFIFVVARYLFFYRHLIVSAFSNNIDNSDRQGVSFGVRNVEIFTGIVGVVFISLLVMRLLVMKGSPVEIWNHFSLSLWGVGAASLGSLALIIFGERAMLAIVGAVSECREACKAIWQMKMAHFSIIILLLSPMIILTLLTGDSVAQIALYVSATICLISLILFIKDTFLLFRSQRFSIFHWILYLCALEIFPLSLLLAPILRG